MLKLAEKELISELSEQICSKQTGCEYMFEKKRLDDLALLFRVFKRDQQTFPAIIEKMNAYIMQRGKTIFNDENLIKDPIQFTKQLILLKEEIDTLVRQCFCNHVRF